MKKYFFPLSIAICFIGCVFLLTAGGGGGGGKNTTTPSTTTSKTVQFKFGNWNYWCAGATNPLAAVWNDRYKRFLIVDIMGTKPPFFKRNYKGNNVLNRYNAGGCFANVQVPKYEDFIITCCYHETYPCGNQSDYECYRWYKQYYHYYNFGDLDCSWDIIYVNEPNPKGFIGRCDEM